MREYRHFELRSDLESRARLRRVEQQVAARTIDKEAAQPKLGDRPLGLAGGPVSVIAVNRREAINASGMSRRQFCQMIIHGHDGLMRHVPVRIRDQVAGYVDHARG
jgi:hypothetical protein